MTKELKKIERLSIKYNWSEVEKQHAIENINNEYGDEHIIELKNGKNIHTSKFPEDCTYVRVTQDGFELAYWISDEWKDEPEIVMGAFLGSLSSN